MPPKEEKKAPEVIPVVKQADMPPEMREEVSGD
jgi:hypothetical protein